MSTLMFWNKQNVNQNNQNNDSKNGKRNWLHAPDALLNGHVVYLVKFLGTTPVEQPKGIEVVKDAIRRLQFAQQMKKVDTGSQSKLKKVEITVSVDGVAVQEPRTQKILHQFPLHNISYCADEKGVKKFFSFIAKNGQSNNNDSVGQTNGHSNGNPEDGYNECFVFVSSKLASDITLTIGQAFDLAYRRYINENGKTTELSKIQLQNKQLENTVTIYKNRLKDLAGIVQKSELDKMLSRLGIRDLFEVPQIKSSDDITLNGNKKSTSECSTDENLLIETQNVNSFVPTIPPRNIHNQMNNTLEAFKPSGLKMDELLLNSDSDSDFDPRAEESENGNKISNDLFGFEPSKTFGQQLFTNNNNNNNNNNNSSNNYVNRTVSPPPLLAPPPKSAVPRRSAGLNNGGSQDLFGSTPFNPNGPHIFDDKFQSDVNQSPIASSCINDKLSNSSVTAISTKYEYQPPSLELNSSPFRNIHENPIKSQNINNPFNNESGFGDMNNSTKLNHSNILNDLNALSKNSSNLDGVLYSSLSDDSIGSNKYNDLSINDKTTSQPSGFSLPSAGIFNPFSKSDSLSIPRGGTNNYDALRNSPDFYSMQVTPPTNIASSSPISINSSYNKGLNNDKSPANSYDIFKDAASQAFSELNPDKSSLSKIVYEFSNKMAGANFGLQSKDSFSGNNKQNLVDEFSLESLDPLKK